MDILIAEDNATSAAIYRYMAAEVGASVHIVDSAEEALEIISTAGPPALLLVNDKLKGQMLGRGLLKEVRTRLGPNTPRCVMVTAGNPSEMGDVPVDQILEKPVDIRILRDEFAKAVGRSAGQAQGLTSRGTSMRTPAVQPSPVIAPWYEVRRAILRVLLVGTAITVGVTAFVSILMPAGSISIETQALSASEWMSRVGDADFASKASGSCAGWDATSVWLWVVQGMILWWCYVCIAVALAKLHPVPVSAPASRYSLPFSVAFFFLCGLGHLWEVVTAFWPVYRIAILSGLVNSFASAGGILYIATALVQANARMKYLRAENEFMRSQLRAQQ